jgi:hypothetical protein
MDFESAQIMVFVGKPKSGKSFMIRALMKQFGRQGIFKFGKVFSGTGKINTDYDFMPEGGVDGDFSEAKLQTYIGKLTKWCEDHKGKKLPPNFLILDDLLGILRPNSGVFSHLISMHRHLSLTIIIVSQYLVKVVSTTLRELTNHAFMFRSQFKNTRQALFNGFGQICENEEEFLRLYDDAVKEKHACLKYTADAPSVAEAYISYKAPTDDKPFTLKFEVVK